MENSKIDLLCSLPRASSLQQLCDLTYQILGNPVFISDLAHTILAYTKCVEIPDPIWQENIVKSHLDRNTLCQEREVSAVHDSSTAEHRPVLVEDSYLPFPRIIKALTHKGQAIGVMVVTAYLTPFAREDTELVELISSFVVSRLVEDRYHIIDDRQSVENFFINLLDGAPFSPERVRRRLEMLGYRPRSHTYVLAISGGHGDEPATGTDLDGLLQQFRLLGSCRVFLYNTHLICVYGSEEDILNWNDQAPDLAALLRRENLLCGISREVRDAGMREYYRQAQAALETGFRLCRPDSFYPYDSLSSFTLFQNLPREDLDLYCHQRISELNRYDETHGMELCATLQVYLEQAKSLARTAEILFIHRNTVRYRIKKCMELMHTDLEDGNEIFAYILSLRILEYQKKFP